MARPARRKWLTIPTRIVLGYIVVLVAFLLLMNGLAVFLRQRAKART